MICLDGGRTRIDEDEKVNNLQVRLEFIAYHL